MEKPSNLRIISMGFLLFVILFSSYEYLTHHHYQQTKTSTLAQEKNGTYSFTDVYENTAIYYIVNEYNTECSITIPKYNYTSVSFNPQAPSNMIKGLINYTNPYPILCKT